MKLILMKNTCCNIQPGVEYKTKPKGLELE